MRIHIVYVGIIAVLLMSCQALAQTFSVGSSGMTITAGTPMFIDSLVVIPSSNTTLTSNSVSRSTSATSVNGVSSIMNQFTFATPVSYNGTVAMGYTTAQLNGNPASELLVAYNGTSGGTYTLNCGSTVDTTNQKVTSSAITSGTLYNISAVKSSVNAGTITGVSSLNVGTTTGMSTSSSNGTWSSSNTSLASVDTSGTVTGIAGGIDTILYTVTNTCNTASAIKPLNVNGSSQWIGTTSTDWSNNSNWSTGLVPTSMVNATIPSGTPYSPQVISGSYRAKDVAVASGAVVTLSTGASLRVKGDVNNSGSFSGSGTLKLDTSVTQSIDGVGHIRHLELNNAAGASINSGAKLTIDSLLTITSGTLTTNDSLVLGSDASTTARLAELPASGAAISGKVKVQQYIPGGYRRFRFWSHPFSNYIPLSQVQNYIDVTGTGGAANGFTTTGSNAPSAFRYDPTVGNSSLSYDIGWRPFASAYATVDSNRFKQYQGIRLYMRGAKGEGLGYASYTPSAANISMWGNVNQGSQTVILSKGSAANQEYNMVGNPYPSPVDIGTVIYNAKMSGNVTGSAFYVWNASMGTAGQFQAIFINTASPSPYYLPAYCAFQVRAAHNGDSLVFAESNKNATSTTTLFKNQRDFLSLNIYDANYHLWDVFSVQFNESASGNEDSKHDATKPSGPDFNFYSLAADGTKLAIDARPYVPGTTIPLGLNSSYAQDFIVKADNVAVPEGGKVYLHDKLLKQYVLMEPGAEYKFSVTDKAATQGNERFELSVEPGNVSTTANTNGLSVSLYPNPANDAVNLSFSSASKAYTSISITDVSGTVVYTEDLGMQQKGSRKINVSRFAAGVYMVELISGSEKIVQRLIRE